LNRLDNYLVEKGLVQSRNKAQSIIKEGLVSVDGKTIKKPSFNVDKHNMIDIQDYKSYVSRSAYKLDEFLNEIDISFSSRLALDIGSSTGGFTQVLLQRGVDEVYCVDVGSNQLHKLLRDDNRVNVFENCDIRDFNIDKRFNIVVSDVAFISLLYILDDVDRLALEDIVLLFKPQFEVGKEVKRDKNGVVLDKKAILKAMVKFEDACKLKNWNLIKKSESKLSGKNGNLEYCYYFKK
jgi:23S rRNA (cytidine1920-2'-O)/16S rRNA (cytidine1409-2'-O)-methyltransferase